MFYTIHQLAQSWGFTDACVRDLIRSGRLKAVKIGNRFRIPQKSAEEFLAASAVEAEAKN